MCETIFLHILLTVNPFTILKIDISCELMTVLILTYIVFPLALMQRFEDRNSYVPVILFNLLRRQEGIKCIEHSTYVMWFDREYGLTALLIQIFYVQSRAV
jgi:hypothetical protein